MFVIGCGFTRAKELSDRHAGLTSITNMIPGMSPYVGHERTKQLSIATKRYQYNATRCVQMSCSRHGRAGHKV